MISISNTEIATFDRCRRKWYLKYFLGMTPADESPVGVAPHGIRVHAALEGYYGYGLPPTDVIDALYALAIEADPDYRTELLAERETAIIMITGYLDWVADTGRDAHIQVVATEMDVEVPFPAVPGVSLKARLDQVIINNETNLLSFLDHKTAANFDTHEILALNTQFKHYSVVQRLIANQMAAEDGKAHAIVAGGMVNTLRRVKRTARSEPPYYQRDGFRYSPTELDAAEARIAKICADIVHVREMLDATYREGGGDLDMVNPLQRYLLYPSPQPRDCKWSCPFLGVCPMMDDDSDWPGVLMRSGKYRQGDPYSYYREDPLRAARQRLGMSDAPGIVG